MKTILILTTTLLITIFGFSQNKKTAFEPGKPWYDTDRNPIEAHGGGIVYINKIYYWYGENKSKGHGNKTGVSCYSSTDLMNWKNEGVVLRKEELPEIFQDNGVCERPKVIYNKKNNNYVMWMHLDGNNYTEASAGVAIAEKPNGPFKFLSYKRPIKFEYDYISLRGPANDPKEKERGNTYRDMNLFLDDNGKAYVFYASEDNATLYISQLNDDFTDVVRPEVLGKTWQRIFVKGNREAPAPFKYNGNYYIITSGLTGWAPNAAQYAVSKNILGPYEVKGNPCRGFESEITFRAQSTFVLPAPNATKGNFIFMADRWLANDITHSSYVWLPFYINEKNDFEIEYFDKWDFSIFNSDKNLKVAQIKGLNVLINENGYYLTWQPQNGVFKYKIYKDNVMIGTSSETSIKIDEEIAEKEVNYFIIANYGFGKDAPQSTPLKVKFELKAETNLTYIVPDKHTQGWGNLMRNQTIDNDPINCNGKAFKSGIGTHAQSETVFNLNGKYDSFQVLVGRNRVPKNGKVLFKIYVDGELKAKSDTMDSKMDAQKLMVNVKGAKELKLVAEDGNDTNDYDHVGWIEPTLYIENKK